MNVYHNYGRWITRCPSPVCLGELLVQRGQSSTVCDCRDLFLCQHGPLCGIPVILDWPDDPDAIVAALSHRPVEHRNWHPGETIADLIRENMEHALI